MIGFEIEALFLAGYHLGNRVLQNALFAFFARRYFILWDFLTGYRGNILRWRWVNNTLFDLVI